MGIALHGCKEWWRPDDFGQITKSEWFVLGISKNAGFLPTVVIFGYVHVRWVLSMSWVRLPQSICKIDTIGSRCGRNRRDGPETGEMP